VKEAEQEKKEMLILQPLYAMIFIYKRKEALPYEARRKD
jgi:hypothetical protein